MQRICTYLVVLLALACPSAGYSYVVDSPRTADSIMLTDNQPDADPNIVSDGSTTTLLVWAMTSGTLTGAGSDTGVGNSLNESPYIKRSTDFGKTWTPAVRLAPLGSLDDGDDLMPNMVTDKKGTWIVVWYGKRSTGNSDRDRDIYFTRSTDNGQTFSAIATLNTNSNGDGISDIQPRLATDGNGTWICVWATIPSGRSIRYARFTNNGQTWSAPTALTPNANYNDYPHIKFIGDHTWLLTYAGNLNNTLPPITYRMLSVNDGVSFSGALQLGTGTLYDYVPDIATDQTSTVLVGWISGAAALGAGGYQLRMARSTDRGLTFAASQPVASSAADAQGSGSYNFIDRVGNGTWLWIHMGTLPGSPHRILYSQSADGITWSPLKYINRESQANQTLGDITGITGHSFTSDGQGHIQMAYNTYNHPDNAQVEGDVVLTHNAPQLDVQPRSLSFATPDTTQTLAVYNVGTYPLNISVHRGGTRGADYVFSGDTTATSITLTAETSTTLRVGFKPQAGFGLVRAGSALFSSDAETTPTMTIPLTGQAPIPTASQHWEQY